MRAVTQSGRRSALGRNGSSAQCRLLAKSGHFGPRLLPGGTLSTRSSALPPDPKRRLPGEAAIERPTNSPTPERQAFPQAAWSHAQGVEEGTWIGLASRAWRSRPRTTLDRPHPPRTSLLLPWLPRNQGMPSRRGPFLLLSPLVGVGASPRKLAPINPGQSLEGRTSLNMGYREDHEYRKFFPPIGIGSESLQVNPSIRRLFLLAIALPINQLRACSERPNRIYRAL
jgi:hypothetical protein